jgi:capsule polysaccharide export protein KpsE/RkpR
MEGLTTRKRYLRKEGAKRKSAIKGKKPDTGIRKLSSKFEKIRQNNDLIIKQLRSNL